MSIRLDPEVRARIERLAAADERSVSSYINRAPRAHIDATEAQEPQGKRTGARSTGLKATVYNAH
jgi:predicted transcriptional regulator